MQHKDTAVTDWIFLSKDGQDEYINAFAASQGVAPVSELDYAASRAPIVLRGILKYKIMHQCWQDQRDFYYMDTGYFGNARRDKKLWHRIVKNDLQHGDIVPRSGDRLSRFNIPIPKRRYGRRIILAVPDEKPCRFYNINRDQWISDTVSEIKRHTDRPIIIRERVKSRNQRMFQDPLAQVLTDDVHALVTFNSVAATESVLTGVPAFVLAPTNAAKPVANIDLSDLEDPYWPDQDKLYAWACHLAYGQFHVQELKNGTAYRILNAH